MISRISTRAAWLCAAISLLTLAGCAGGEGRPRPFQVGTTTFDPNLPPEPQLPRDDQVCATLEASNNLVKRPDGALPPEADDTALEVNPDQARIQAALNACGASVDAEVGTFITGADSAAAAAQVAAADPLNPRNVTGATGEELAKPLYRASRFAVRLVKSSTGPGDSFISGPLTIPSGVTLWIDQGVTLFATRDVIPFNLGGGRWCGNTYSGLRAGSSGNCRGFLNGANMVNTAVMGEGSIDSRAYAEIISSDPLYPLMRVDLTCTNTYAAWLTAGGAVQAPVGTPCDNGGTVVKPPNANTATARNMTWWDLAYLANMVENGRTGSASQSVFRMMVFNNAKNLTLYKITLNNSANFHFVPLGIDGLTVWGVKLQTPSQAAYANPAGNGNPLYTGEKFTKDNVKNTDAFDPGSAAAPTLNAAPVIGINTNGTNITSATTRVNFDGYLKNVVFAYNFVSTGDDDIVLKGSNNPSPLLAGVPVLPGIDGNQDVRSDRRYGVVIAHNHIYWGHGISIGSETNSGVRNVHVYDNSFNESEEGLRIKSDQARGGDVNNIYYDNICIRDAENALLYTAYYSTRVVPGTGVAIPNFHDIHMNNVRIQGTSNVVLVGWAAIAADANLGTPAVPAYPLTMWLSNVVADSPDKISLESSDAELTLSGVNLPLLPAAESRVVVNGEATKAVDPSQTVDCSRAYVDFPTLTSPGGTSW
jgi:polygalacturonase